MQFSISGFANFLFVRAKFPLEVFQLKESQNDDQIYVENENEQYNTGEGSLLEKLFKQYKRKNSVDNDIAKVAKSLVEKIKYLGKDTSRNKNKFDKLKTKIYIINGELLSPYDNSDASDDQYSEFVDQTRDAKENRMTKSRPVIYRM